MGGYAEPGNAASIAAQSGPKGSHPTDNRINPSGTASPQRARRSPEVCVDPKLVACAMNGQSAKNFSATTASRSVKDIKNPNPDICRAATAYDGSLESPG